MQSGILNMVSRMSSYSWKNVLFRLSVVSSVGFSFMLFANYIAGDPNLNITVVQYFKVVLIFNLITEFNVLLDNLSERYFPIPEKLKIRVLLHLLLSVTIGLSSVFYFDEMIGKIEMLKNPIVLLMFAFGIIFIFILIVISISMRITEQWINSQHEIEELKSAKLLSDYSSLQDQLNPHFLFNNLSVLKSLIMYDRDTALIFTQNFTDVYRYVLQSKEKTTVRVSDEIEFIESYLGLHKERIGEGLVIEITVERSAMQKEIPPLALQLLVENAIKHNIASAEKPLILKITANDQLVKVENNIQLKDASYSTNMGLQNLIKRYTLLTSKKVIVNCSDQQFCVELPLL